MVELGCRRRRRKPRAMGTARAKKPAGFRVDGGRPSSGRNEYVYWGGAFGGGWGGMALFFHYSLLSIGRDCFAGGWNSGDALPKTLDTLGLKARWSCVDEGAGTSRQQALPPTNIVTITLAPLSLSPWTVHGCLASRYPALHLPRPSQTYPDSSATDEAGRQDIRDFIPSF